MKVDNVRGHLDLVLLEILSQHPGHGYAVISILRDRTAGRLDLTEGAVYPALHRLEDLGWLASEWAPVAGRRRRLYRVSEQGQVALRAQRRDWRTLVTAIESVLGPKDAAAVSTP